MTPDTMQTLNLLVTVAGFALTAARVGALLATISTKLDGAAYAAWGADDEYLYRYSAESLGLTIIEIVRGVAQAAAPVVEPPAPAGGTHD